MDLRLLLVAFSMLTLAVLPGCQSVYYGTLEKFGYEKREILVDRVEDARDEQEDAKQQFATALDQFKSVVNFDGGDLEKMYKQLAEDYEDSEEAAEDVSGKIGSVESVAEALFAEWTRELDEYTDPRTRSTSEQMLRDTQQRYEKMVDAMRRAEATMQPVLAAMKDQVLFLKHNLNAQAISSIQGSATEIEQDVEKLIAEMERSIAEANAFIDQMPK
ncbi:MAG: DUF2959 domain-containing protein [Planctomycetota bacterium]